MMLFGISPVPTPYLDAEGDELMLWESVLSEAVSLDEARRKEHYVGMQNAVARAFGGR